MTGYEPEITDNGDGTWTVTYLNLPGLKNKSYSVSESSITGYTSETSSVSDRGTLTNKLETITVAGEKTWEDNNNENKKRPGSITVNLLANGALKESKTVQADENGKWIYSFENLPKYVEGQEIQYTVSEGKISGYTAEITGYNIVNTYTPGRTSIKVTKVWDDNENQDGKRPESVEVQLYADGQVKGASVTLNDANQWTYNWSDLDDSFTYTVEEMTELSDYKAVVKGNGADGYIITNSHIPETTSVSITKVWSDSNNQDGIRPSADTFASMIHLYSGDTEMTGVTPTVTDNGDNTYTVTYSDLPKYSNGNEIVYTVKEAAVNGYTSSTNEGVADGSTITNSHTPETTSVSGTKTWDDGNNQDGKRPQSITVNLLADGEQIKSTTVSADADGNWNYLFTNLPKYESGQKIKYTVTENAVKDYSTVINGYNITNSYTPGKTSVTVTKSWEDNSNQDGKRPESVTVQLLANGEKSGDAITLSDANGWTYTWSGLDEMKAGSKISYTVEESTKVDGYTTAVAGSAEAGYIITNSHTPETTSVSGTKTWNEGNNQDGKRPESITVNLLANGVKIDSKSVSPDETGSWIYSFENLPKYQNGQEITYTVTENAVAEYSTTIDGYNITNSYTPGKTSVTVTKSWKDSNNQDGKRPENVTVQLLADGEKSGDAITLSEANSWTYTWSGLDKMKAGSKISYTVDEVTKVDGYTTSVTGSAEAGYIITNSHTPETVSVSGTKTWDDGNNQDGKRPDSITVNLLADGILKDSKSVSPDENGKWTYSFENLPKYQNGNKIVYTVSEEPVADYSTTIHGYDITNSYTPGKTSVTVTKIWSDSNNRDGLRPSAESFASKLHLYDGDAEVTGVTPAVTDNGNSTYTVTYSDLPAYANGSLIVYTVREDSISGYTADKESVKNGETLTNTHTVTPAPSPTSTPTPTSTPGSSAPGSAEPYTPNTSSSSGTGTAARPYTPNTSDRTSVPLYAGMFLVSSAVVLMMLTKWRKELFRR